MSFETVRALLVNYTRNRSNLTADTLIGVFLSVSLALGASLLLILASRVNIHILENVLFGSVLTVDDRDLTVLLAVAAGVTALMLPPFNRLLLASFNPALARVRGVPLKGLDYLFIVLVTVVTAASVKIIGAILVGALLVIPAAAAARVVASSLRGFFLLSVAFASVAAVAGILLPVQFALPIPSGGAIILAAAVLSDRFATLAADLGLDLRRVWTSDDRDWTPDRLAELTATLKAEAIPVVLHHRQPAPEIVRAVTDGGARLVVLDSLENGPPVEMDMALSRIAEQVEAGLR